MWRCWLCLQNSYEENNGIVDDGEDDLDEEDDGEDDNQEEEEEVVNFDLKPQGSFLLSSANMTGSIIVEDDNYNKYGHITSVKAHPSGSVGNVEYFLVCD